MQKLLSSLGPVTAIIGAQWGDEGKGKVIDILADHFDVVARACGGANAGHTIHVNGKKHVFRLLPSGSLHPSVKVVLGAGMVIHLPTLLEEIDLLKQAGIEIIKRLTISSSAHIVFDYHQEIDGAIEEKRSTSGIAIGTTKRGIGPAYMDKASRSGIRLEHLGEDLRPILAVRAKEANMLYGVTVDMKRELKNAEEARNVIGKCIVPDAALIELLSKTERILIEGAQATLLDLDHGTYPYVTSSSTTLAGALQGLGVAPKRLTGSIGVAKAYCTRVGGGAFPTEVTGAIGDRIRERGGEYGSVTKRPRRCGWLSLPDLNYAALINGFDCWNITKLDVLDEEDEIPVGIGMKGEQVIYERIPGWRVSTRGITSFKKLPPSARSLIDLIEQHTRLPVRLIGTGEGREEMIVKM